MNIKLKQSKNLTVFSDGSVCFSFTSFLKNIQKPNFLLNDLKTNSSRKKDKLNSKKSNLLNSNYRNQFFF